jgi:hypothetical protein
MANVHQRTKNMKNLKIRSLLLAVSAVAVTAAAHATVTWSASPVAVNRVDVEATYTGSTADGEVYVGFSEHPFPISSMPAACNKAKYGLWIIGGNTESRKQLLQVALSAKLSGQKVKVLWNGDVSGANCTGGTNPGYPILRGLEVQP